MGDLLARFAKAAEKQIDADGRWLRAKGWSRRTIGRMGEERRSHLGSWEKMPPVDAAKFLLQELNRPRSKRIGR